MQVLRKRKRKKKRPFSQYPSKYLDIWNFENNRYDMFLKYSIFECFKFSNIRLSNTEKQNTYMCSNINTKLYNYQMCQRKFHVLGTFYSYLLCTKCLKFLILLLKYDNFGFSNFLNFL